MVVILPLDLELDDSVRNDDSVQDLVLQVHRIVVHRVYDGCDNLACRLDELGLRRVLLLKLCHEFLVIIHVAPPVTCVFPQLYSAKQNTGISFIWNKIEVRCSKFSLVIALFAIFVQ